MFVSIQFLNFLLIWKAFILVLAQQLFSLISPRNYRKKNSRSPQPSPNARNAARPQQVISHDVIDHVTSRFAEPPEEVRRAMKPPPLKLKVLSIFIQKWPKVDWVGFKWKLAPVYEADCFAQPQPALNFGHWGARSAHSWIRHWGSAPETWPLSDLHPADPVPSLSPKSKPWLRCWLPVAGTVTKHGSTEIPNIIHSLPTVLRLQDVIMTFYAGGQNFEPQKIQCYCGE